MRTNNLSRFHVSRRALTALRSTLWLGALALAASAAGCDARIPEPSGTAPAEAPSAAPAVAAPGERESGPVSPGLTAALDTPAHDHEHAVPESPRRVWFAPEDMTTAVGDTPPELSIMQLDNPVTEAQLRALAKTLTLVTEPEGTPVAYDIEYEIPETKAEAGAQQIHRGTIRLTPKEPLEQRWYALRVDALPEGYEAAKSVARDVLGEGTIGSRFRPDSHPVVKKIEMCGPREHGHRVAVTFSERVTASRSLAGIARVEHTSGAQPKCSPLAAPDSAAGDMAVVLDCAGVRFDAPLRVAIEPGLRGVARDTDGTARAVAPVTRDLSTALALDDGAPACTEIRGEIPSEDD